MSLERKAGPRQREPCVTLLTSLWFLSRAYEQSTVLGNRDIKS